MTDLPIVLREQWGHNLPLKSNLRLPVSEIWLHHTVTKPTTNPIKDMLTIQDIGRQRFGIFPYSYVIHPIGTIMEGAGLTVGAHTKGHNSTGLGIAWIGNYQNDTPTKAIIESTAKLITKFIQNKCIKPRIYPTGGHRNVAQTACPGTFAYQVIPAIRTRINELLQPKPTPEPELETEMNPIILRYSNGAVLWDGKQLIRITGESNVKNAPIETWTLTDPQFQCMVKYYGPVKE